MRKIRVGNDFWQTFQIKENGVEVDLLSIKETVRMFAKVDEHCFQVPSELITVLADGIITLEVKTELFSRVGRYEIIVKYIHDDTSMSDDDRKRATNFTAFAIVGKTEMADESEDIPIVSDILIGLKGDKGDPFTYEDFTPEQLEDLQKPLTNFVAIAEVAENQREQNEGVRVDNENIRISNEDERILSENTRVSNESDRVDAEIIREQQEEARQANTATAISNAETATTNANDSADFAQTQGDYAKQQGEAIQDDLALKANHGYDSNPKTLKEVEDNASVKMTNLVVNGGFESGFPKWFSTQPILSGEEKMSGDSSGYLALASNTSYSLVDIACDLNDKLYISVSRRFKSVVEAATNRIAVFDFGGLENRLQIAPFYNGNLDVWETTTAIVDGRTNGIRLSAGFFNAATAQYFVDNFIAINLTETFGEGNEPTKEEFDLLLATLGIDYFEGEIAITAQKMMQWQLALIRKNKNDIDLVLTTENENWEV